MMGPEENDALDGRSQPSRLALYRLLAASPLPLLVGLWALWRDVYTLEAAGLVRTGGPKALAEWALMSVVSLAVVASFWAGERAVRVLGCTAHALLLSFAFGVAGVLGVMHAFGGPSGNLDAPAWALAGLGVVAALCVVGLLATAAIIVEDVRAAGEEEE
jgi:hypothetical protein